MQVLKRKWIFRNPFLFQSSSRTIVRKRRMCDSLGSTEIWTRTFRFKVQGANHYTIEPCDWHPLISTGFSLFFYGFYYLLNWAQIVYQFRNFSIFKVRFFESSFFFTCNLLSQLAIFKSWDWLWSPMIVFNDVNSFKVIFFSVVFLMKAIGPAGKKKL